jgi:hypothetical protein
MTVESEKNRMTPYTTNGVTTEFAFDFEIYADSRLILTDTPSRGTPQTLVLDTDYSVVGKNGGTVTTIGAPLAAGTLDIVRHLPITQKSNLISTGPFNNEVVEQSLDKGTVVDLQQQEQIDELYFPTEHDNGNSGVTDTINWRNGLYQKSTLTENCTFTFIIPYGPAFLKLKLIQDATGGRTVTWPAAVKWAGGTALTLSTAANAVDLIEFYYDGTYYYGSAILNLS